MIAIVRRHMMCALSLSLLLCFCFQVSSSQRMCVCVQWHEATAQRALRRISGHIRTKEEMKIFELGELKRFRMDPSGTHSHTSHTASTKCEKM